MVRSTPKIDRERDTGTFAKGGEGRANHMVKPQAAGPAKPGRVGKVETPAPGAKAAKGGPKTGGYGLALPRQGR
jgi:hypothetical protein